MDFLENEFEEILNVFREESEEYIQKLNQNLLELEKRPYDIELISELFREAHSLKGAARMIGLIDIQSVAHKMEDLFGMAKEGTIQINSALIDILCQATDCIASIINESIKSKGTQHFETADEMVQRLEAQAKQASENPNSQTDNKKEFLKRKDAPVFNEKATASKYFKQIKDKTVLLKKENTNFALIEELFKLVVDLFSLIKEHLEPQTAEYFKDLKAKLESTVRGSGMLLEIEVEEMESLVETCRLKAEKELNLEHINQETIKQQEHDTSNLSRNEKEIPEEQFISAQTINILSEIEKFLTENTQDEFKNEESKTRETLIILFNSLINCISMQAAKNAVLSVQKVIELFYRQKGKVDAEMITAVQESFLSLKQIILSNETDPEESYKITQRMEIITKISELSANEKETEDNKEAANELIENKIAKHDELPPKTSLISTQRENTDFDSKKPETSTIKTLRVDTNKLDSLVNQVGELIIAKIKSKEHITEIEKTINLLEEWQREWIKNRQSLKNFDAKVLNLKKLPQGTSIYSPNKSVYDILETTAQKAGILLSNLSYLYKTVWEDQSRLNLIVNDLEEKVKNIRVLPLATIFHMFPRMVRDIATEKGKKIELVISGSETSVDKKILEEIKSPLMHILRNSVDHGIETPDQREIKGKPQAGTINLSARHLENTILIEISDDGKGIRIDELKKKVLEKNLLNPEELQNMNEEQITNIIFWPGFSTGESTTDISGRGVGLDVVYTKINELNGKVSVKSTPDKGVKFSIQIPVAMATIKSFLVKVKNQTFALPTSSIKTTLLVKPSDIFLKGGRETIIFDNQTIGLYKLSQILEIQDEASEQTKIIVIVIEAEGTNVGIIVDKLIGDQEILHKNFNPPLVRVRNIAGLTVLGSGELCLILNVNEIVKSALIISGSRTRSSPVKKEKKQTQSAKILVVDDSVTTRILEKNILKAAGYDVSVSTNGLEALTQIHSEKFDLIVSDIEMPEMNGFELTKKIREDKNLSKIPIILVTSLVSEKDRNKGLESGANEYINKSSFDQEELLLTVKRLLEESCR